MAAVAVPQELLGAPTQQDLDGTTQMQVLAALGPAFPTPPPVRPSFS